MILTCLNFPNHKAFQISPRFFEWVLVFTFFIFDFCYFGWSALWLSQTVLVLLLTQELKKEYGSINLLLFAHILNSFLFLFCLHLYCLGSYNTTRQTTYKKVDKTKSCYYLTVSVTRGANTCSTQRHYAPK